MPNLKRDYIEWFIWLFFVILWNYGYPEATPFYDVLVAVILSLIFIIIKNIEINNPQH